MLNNPEESLKLNKKEHFSSPIGGHSIIAHKPSERRTETEVKSAVSVLLPTGLSLSWCLQNNITFKHDNALTIRNNNNKLEIGLVQNVKNISGDFHLVGKMPT